MMHKTSSAIIDYLRSLSTSIQPIAMSLLRPKQTTVILVSLES